LALLNFHHIPEGIRQEDGAPHLILVKMAEFCDFLPTIRPRKERATDPENPVVPRSIKAKAKEERPHQAYT